MHWSETPPAEPLAILHRGGNEPRFLARAVASGVDVVEADVWHYKGRLELRHARRLRFPPLIWERWRVEPGWTLQFQVAQLLALAGPSVQVMLDLKGNHPEDAAPLFAAIGAAGRDQAPAICARNWSLLEPFRADASIPLVYSAGTQGQLARLQQHLRAGACSTIAVHERLLTRALVEQLRQRARLLMSWPVNSERRMRELVDWGVNGITSDRLDLLRTLKAGARIAAD